ncbi:tRNA lysidine(34) synthetase TilS [Kocuria salsicia]|uniref:tRNA(Ile)-lysidine synthase n=1 Tax=Kocuria salsicia TaxID=664639 RepID=A0ABV3KE25_9MICC
MQQGRFGRLNPVVARARRAVARGVSGLDAAGSAPPLVLVGCSGGADSLALAAAALHLQRRGGLRVGAVVVDHQLQDGSQAVARRTAEVLRVAGADPVLVERVTVSQRGHGPEMAARLARYAAFQRAVARTGAAAVLLGHTRDDQAETVLLGLTRGSGTRSLAGMSERHVLDGVTYLRPFLWLTRTETETVCAAEGLDPWLDPTNRDTTLTRSRIRHDVLPHLERELGPGVAKALARTASVLGADADYLDEQALAALAAALVQPGTARQRTPQSAPEQDPRPAHLSPGPRAQREPERPGGAAPSSVVLDAATVQATPPALRRRLLARACALAGGETPTFERLAALEDFALGHGAAGPVQLAGKVTAWRHRADAEHARGCLELRGGSGSTPQQTTPTQNNPGSAQ